MKAPGRTNRFDLLVVSGSEATAALAQQVRDALVARGFLVRTAGASPSSTPVLATEVQADVASAVFSLALSRDGEVTQYALVPAPLYIGQEPRFAKLGERAGAGEIEIGTIEGDPSALVERLAGRLRIGR